MKILTVIYNLDKGGTQRAAQTFAEAYSKIGHFSRILSLYGLGSRYDEIKDFMVVYDGITRTNLQKIREWKPDLIHIHSHGPKEEDIKLLFEATDLETKIVETNVFSTPSPWAGRIDVSFQLSNWAQWLFNLRGGKKYISAIVPYPVKVEAFEKAESQKLIQFRSQYGIPEDSFLIGRIGQAYDTKWSGLLIKSFDDLAEKNAKFYLMIVNPPASIIRQAHQSKFKERIIHIPQIIGDKNLQVAYSAMDLMVLVADQGESFGMVIPEAILCETPVVTLSTPWVDNSQCEVVRNGKGGLVVNSFQGLKKAIIFFYDNLKTRNFEVDSSHVYDDYDYLKVAQLAIDYANNKDISEDKKRKVIDILEDSFDKVNFSTKFCIQQNNNFYKHLTGYTSGYISWRIFARLLVKKFSTIAKI